MSMTDPISDLLTRIRNAQRSGKPDTSVSSSKLKVAVVKVLKEEGYVADYAVTSEGNKSRLDVRLKYYEGRPVIDRIERVSKPSLRVYKGKDDLPKILGGMGTVIVSTPKGVMTDKQARATGQGGEVLCIVS